MRKRFLDSDKAILTVMVQNPSKEAIINTINEAKFNGAEAFGIQFETLDVKHRNRQDYIDIFKATGDLPIYITNYRRGSNEGKSDDILASELLEIAAMDSLLIDVMGDFFGEKNEFELTMDEVSVDKQMKLIDEIHKKGSLVMMSSHVCKFIPLEKVLEIAFEQKRRGADIIKIVTGASNIEEQIENLRITNVLKEQLDKPFLFLSNGECSIHRRLGIKLGCCMSLCVYQRDEWAYSIQPLLEEQKQIRDELNF